jgi:hypothetical protein
VLPPVAPATRPVAPLLPLLGLPGPIQAVRIRPRLEASGPEDAARYGRRTEAGIWKGYAAPKEPGKSDSGRLLRGKRSRDLLDEVRQAPPRPDAGRRLEEAEKKVRKFLKSLYAVEK